MKAKRKEELVKTKSKTQTEDLHDEHETKVGMRRFKPNKTQLYADKAICSCKDFELSTKRDQMQLQ